MADGERTEQRSEESGTGLSVWPIAIVLGLLIGGERFRIFDAIGAVVFGLLTRQLLAAWVHRDPKTLGTTNATAR